MRILVAPDSFKGSASAKDISKMIASALKEEIKDAEVDVVPMADGCEGTIDALLYSSMGKKVTLTVTGPTGKKVETFYGVLYHSNTVIIEVATIAGYTCVSDERRNPYYLTTYGVGECIIHALDAGYRNFIVCLGGSATNDGGLGMLQQLGVQFKNQKGREVSPYPYELETIESVDYHTIDERLRDATIQVASDVANPLCGKNGATYIFGPQKGVKQDQLAKFDEHICTYAERIEEHLQKKYHHVQGAGAAGGLGFALLTIGAKMESGAKLIAKSLDLEAKIQQ